MVNDSPCDYGDPVNCNRKQVVVVAAVAVDPAMTDATESYKLYSPHLLSLRVYVSRDLSGSPEGLIITFHKFTSTPLFQ